jgi:hypothetical protein
MPDETQAAADDAHSEAMVEIGDKASLKRWSEALGVTGEALESAVKAVGPRVDKIKDFLGGGMAGQQSDA